MSLGDHQKRICHKYSARYQHCDLNLKVGISENIRSGARPIHGVRLKEEHGTSGWYIWAGEWLDDPAFYVPLHGTHLHAWAEIALPYLGLPEGWRFLITENYEDVWHAPHEVTE